MIRDDRDDRIEYRIPNAHTAVKFLSAAYVQFVAWVVVLMTSVAASVALGPVARIVYDRVSERRARW